MNKFYSYRIPFTKYILNFGTKPIDKKSNGSIHHFRVFNIFSKTIQHITLKDIEKNKNLIQWQNLLIDRPSGIKDVSKKMI